MPRLLRHPILGEVGIVVLAMLALEAVTQARLVSPLSLTRPSLMFVRLWQEMASGELGRVLALTFYEIFVAFLAISFLGLALGYILWRYETVGRACDPILGAITGVPKVLLFPIAMVFFGRSPAVPMVMGGLLGIIPIIINTRAGFVNVNGIFLKLGKSLNFSKAQTFTKVLLPAAAPAIFSGLKLGLIYTMIGVTGIEFLVEVGGLGKVISHSYQIFDTPTMYAYMIMVLVIAVVMVELVERLEARIR